MFEVRHQDRAMRLLRYALAGERMPHACIFHGPEGVGRALAARWFASVLLCEGEGEEACGACASCALSAAGTHPDLHIVSRDLHLQHPDGEVRKRKGLDLGIDVIRHFVIDAAGRRTATGRGKVFVIQEAERMNAAAQNALLKTLEEPPPGTVVILIASSVDALLPTVRSRCQTFPFGLLPAAFIEERLRALDASITPEEARFCARHGNGSLGVALRHREDGWVEYGRRLTELMGQLGVTGAGELAKRVVEEAKSLGTCCQRHDPEISETEALRRGLRALLSLLAMGLRTTLHACVAADHGGDQGDRHDGGDTFYVSLAERLTPRRATDAVRSIVTAERQLNRNVNVPMCVEGLLIRLARTLGG